MKKRMWVALVPLLALATASATFALSPRAGQEKEQKEERPKTDEKADKADKEKSGKKGAVEVGARAPDFTLKDLDGKTVKLADFKGKTVVLEWFNPDCPAVVKSYGDGSLKGMATRVSGEGVVWLAINSGGPGKQGYEVDANKKKVEAWKLANPILRDETGEVGKAYGAKTTPTMVVIDAKGNVAYRGAIDNNAKGEPEGGTLVNYVANALADLKAGKPVAVAETRAYG